MKPTIKSSQLASCTVALLTITFSSSLPAQNPGTGGNAAAGAKELSESPGLGSANAILERKTARDELQRFLDSRQWQKGENRKADGTFFYIATGSGAISAPRSHPRFIESRVTAFEKAMLAVKAQMSEYIRSSLETRAISYYTEGQAPPPPSSDAATPGMFDKLATLAHKKLDDMLRREGIDPSSPQAKAAAERVKSSDEFQKYTRKESQAYIAGLQAFQTFEVFPDGKNGEIAIVGIVSDKLLVAAAALAGGTPPPLQKPNKPIMEQVPKAGPELLCSFGVRQLVDENGQLVLVAYGQSQPISESTRAELAAEEKAQMQAEGSLRGFAGESVTTARDTFNAETSKEFEDNTTTYENQSAYRERIEAAGKAMQISGIQVIKRWTQKHPLTGQTVVGSVIAWSPHSAAVATALGGKMNAAGQPVGGGKKPQRIPINSDQKGQFNGQGAAGDEDAF